MIEVPATRFSAARATIAGLSKLIENPGSIAEVGRDVQADPELQRGDDAAERTAPDQAPAAPGARRAAR